MGTGKMLDAFICDAIRTPIGRYGGGLATMRPDDLAAHVIRISLPHAAIVWPLENLVQGTMKIPNTCIIKVQVTAVAPPSQPNIRFFSSNFAKFVTLKKLKVRL